MIARTQQTLAEDVPVMSLFYPYFQYAYHKEVFDAWYFTPGGFGGGAPTVYNKQAFVTGQQEGTESRTSKAVTRKEQAMAVQNREEGTRVAPETVEDIVRFHGHMCPGLAMGIRAAEVALREVGPHSSDEEVVALTETNMCAVDAIQYLTGCTFGKGNLIHLDYGKNAYTFIRRSDDKAIRISTRPGAFGRSPEHSELFAKVRNKSATEEERARFKELHANRSEAILRAPEEELYRVEEPEAVEIPPMARIHNSITCADCGEPTMETRVRRLEGKELCPACFDAAPSR